MFEQVVNFNAERCLSNRANVKYGQEHVFSQNSEKEKEYKNAKISDTMPQMVNRKQTGLFQVRIPEALITWLESNNKEKENEIIHDFGGAGVC